MGLLECHAILAALEMGNMESGKVVSEDLIKTGNEYAVMIMRRFHVAAKYLSNRSRDNKKSLGYRIDDEYDVQDLLYAILKPVIHDLEREDPVPKIAGDSGRVDLCSPSCGMVIEIKYAKSPGRASALSSECRERIVLYSNWPHLRHLNFFIYDPGSNLSDPDNFIQGLTSPVTKFGDNEFSVATIISPWQLGVVQLAGGMMPPHFLSPSAIEQLYGQNENLAFTVGQPFYTREREAIIIPMEITNPSSQSNTISEVSITVEGKSYRACRPPLDLITSGGWLDNQQVRFGPIELPKSFSQATLLVEAFKKRKPYA
jgi:hypothetical protein